MPRSKNPENYPDELGQALNAALGNPRGFTITFPSRRDALRFRNQMYAYVNALDAQEREQGLEYDLCLAPKFRLVQITTEGGKLSLLEKQYTSGIQAIRAALTGTGQPAPPDSARLRKLAQEALDAEAGLPSPLSRPEEGDSPLLQPPAPGEDSTRLIEELFGAGVKPHERS